MITCPFKSPVPKVLAFGASAASGRCFEQQEGITLSTIALQQKPTEAATPVAWPFPSFSQLVFLRRGKLAISLPDSAQETVLANEWFALSAKGWPASCAFSEAIEFLVIECSESVWKALATDSDAYWHSKRACMGCAHREEALFLKAAQGPRMLAACADLFSLSGATASELLRVNARTLDLLAFASESEAFNGRPQPEPCKRNLDREAIEAAAAYLEANLEAEHSLAAVSRKACLNEFKLKRGFRERYQTTVFGYLRRKRMERANELLRSGHCNVAQAACEVGYSNPSHFARAFRQEFGYNPNEAAAR